MNSIAINEYLTYYVLLVFSENLSSVTMSTAAFVLGTVTITILRNFVMTKRIFLKHIEMIIWVNHSHRVTFSFLFFPFEMCKIWWETRSYVSFPLLSIANYNIDFHQMRCHCFEILSHQLDDLLGVICKMKMYTKWSHDRLLCWHFMARV